MFDAHCHLDRMEDAKEVWRRARQAGVHGALIAGVNAEGWKKQNEMHDEKVYVAWGLHPWAVANATGKEIQEQMDLLQKMLADPPVHPIALGETGIDHSKRISKESWDTQATVFRQHIQLSKQYDLPLVLHIVRAHEQAISILKDEGLPPSGGMVHSFSGNDVDAKRYINMGLHISFSGTVTDVRRKKLREVARTIPMDRFLVETDAPDQTPITRPRGPNEPAFLVDVVNAVATLREETFETVAKRTLRNACLLFKLEIP